MNKHIKLLLSVIFFGAVWGIVEATLGSILHIGLVADTLGLFATSTVVVVPIAYLLMTLCYKKEGNVRSILYMGLIAAGIKALSCGIFGMNFNPVYHILMESACYAGAVLLVKPTSVASLRTFGAIALANTVYLVASVTFLKMGINAVGSAEWTSFIVSRSGIALVYTFLFGLVAYGLSKIHLPEKVDVNKMLYSPITASVALTLAVVATLILK